MYAIRSYYDGVCGHVNFFTEKGNVFTVDTAVTGFCSYQQLNFSASDHVEILEPKFECNSYIGVFISTIINKNSRNNFV